MTKVMNLPPDEEFISKNFIPSTSFAKHVKQNLNDCFSKERTLKNDYSSLLNLKSDENDESSQTEMVKSIRVKSILSKLFEFWFNPSRLLFYFKAKD
jgi:hypothetical protein